MKKTIIESAVLKEKKAPVSYGNLLRNTTLLFEKHHKCGKDISPPYLCSGF